MKCVQITPPLAARPSPNLVYTVHFISKHFLHKARHNSEVHIQIKEVLNYGSSCPSHLQLFVLSHLPPPWSDADLRPPVTASPASFPRGQAGGLANWLLSALRAERGRGQEGPRRVLGMKQALFGKKRFSLSGFPVTGEFPRSQGTYSQSGIP